MSSGSWATLIALLLLVTGGVASPVAGSLANPATPAAATAQTDVGSTIDTNTTMAVQLAENGDAVWTVTAYFDLSTANETEAFRSLASRFERGEASALGLEAFRRARDEASTVTGREMRLIDVQRSTAPDAVVANGTGWLRLSFTWTNFAKVDGDQLLVGDAFQSADGVWLSSLAADQTLVMRAPTDWAVVDANTSITEATLTWRGPTTLDEASLAATFTGSSVESETPSQSWLVPAILVGVSVVGLGGAYLVARRRDLSLPGTTTADSRSGASDEDGAASTAEAGGDGPGGDAAGDSDEESAEDLELLSDEERVERLLERNGGRMKQASIVKETGWSNAKVSQLLSSMHEDDRIDKLRIGRENLISFPDEDLTDIEE